MNPPFYKGSFLARNSVAYLLYQAAVKSTDKKDWKKLDEHMKQVDQNYQKLHNA